MRGSNLATRWTINSSGRFLSSRSAGSGRPLTIRLNPPSIGPYRRIFSSG